jgi:hypothetical protein
VRRCRNSRLHIGKAKSTFPDDASVGRDRRGEPRDARLNAQRLEVPSEKRDALLAIGGQ